MRSILGRMLRDLGFEIREAKDGHDALVQLKGWGTPDLMLVDWNMPVMNGIEFIQAVRAEHVYDGVLLMMVTTETEMSHVAKAIEAGANEYIMKPFTKDIVLGKLALCGFFRE
jgi:two-component system, chemotaxis family, chemotaxis protein CheY